jgi:NAD(P)H-quinone oxidoreductase subunit 5
MRSKEYYVIERRKRNKTSVVDHSYRFINICVWFLFLANICFLALNYGKVDWTNFGIIRINRFVIMIWSLVSFFEAIVLTYSARYLRGFTHRANFIFLTVGFTISVMMFVASNHILLLLSSWFAMGYFMAKLIGSDRNWAEAQEASKFAQKYFLISSMSLSAGVLLLAFQSGSFRINEIVLKLENLPEPLLTISALFIIIAAMIQSAIYPFHRWLLSAMTAPTPASALMHAGFVNGSGILLTLFSVLLFTTGTLPLLFIIGGVTAIAAQFTKLLQTSVKHKLACSTIAQMGFMIMQCGLGFFNAAIVHLILHGFYKAYLFLSSGENISASIPNEPLPVRIKPLQVITVIIFGLIGAFIFATLTGKGTAMNSGLFLTTIVAITVGQVTYNIVKQHSLSIWQKVFWPPILFFIGIGCYAVMYNGVTKLMGDMPGIEKPLPLSMLQIIMGVIFLVSFFIMKLGVYRKVPWIYVKLLNTSQPYKKTILMFKNNSL